MKFVSENLNPNGKSVGDCVIRAISKALNKSWEEIYIELCIQGYLMADLPSSNQVWGAYLKAKGFTRDIIPNECPDCYTIEDFCNEHPTGTYVVGTGTHAVAIVSGCLYDTWNSTGQVPIYFYYKGD